MHKVNDKTSKTLCSKIIDNLDEWEPRTWFKTYMNKWNGFSAIITGSSRSGKSNMLRYLLSPKGVGVSKYFDLIVIFSRTLCNGFYQSFIDSKLMFSEFKPEIIEDLKNLYNQYKLKGKSFKTLFIFDDLVNQKSKYNEEITNLFYNGRHFEFSLFFLSQKCSLLSTGWVSNCTLFISLFAGSRAEKEYLAEKVIADCIDNDPETYYRNSEIIRNAYLLQSVICQNYKALIILPYDQTKVFWYQAKVIKKKEVFHSSSSIYERFMNR